MIRFCDAGGTAHDRSQCSRKSQKPFKAAAALRLGAAFNPSRVRLAPGDMASCSPCPAVLTSWNCRGSRAHVISMSDEIPEKATPRIKSLVNTNRMKKSDGLLAVGENAPCVILVRTALDENVGSVARAMLNFGLAELRLVSPECDWLTPNARARCCGADIVLEQAKHFDTVEEAVADLHTVYATTARFRLMTQHVMTPEKASAEIVSSEHRSGILFGPERSGMTNEELMVADSLIFIPANPHFSSLNLAQAVNILGYATWQARVKAEGSAYGSRLLRHTLATKSEIANFLRRLEAELDNTFPTQDEMKRVNIYNKLTTTVNRLRLSKSEVKLAHGIINALAGHNADKMKAQKAGRE